MLNKDQILNIKDVIESEKLFISQHSEKKIFDKAVSKISNFFFRNFKTEKILFLCGPGNNGEDGKQTFNKLKKRKNVYLILISNDKHSYNEFISIYKNFDIIVDCIFGIGLNKKISGYIKKIIECINRNSFQEIISIDVPSGIDGDGRYQELVAVKASITLAIGVYKPCHFLNPGKDYCGDIKLLKIDLSNPKNIVYKTRIINKEILKDKIPNWKGSLHKYQKGHVGILGGEMSGASRIVALSSRKIGCGLSSILIRQDDILHYQLVEPGTIVRKLYANNDYKKFDCFVIGPGLGNSFSINELIIMIKEIDCPLIIDADAISIFKEQRFKFYKLMKGKQNLVITPHSGEFERVFKFKNLNKIEKAFLSSQIINNTVIFKGNDTVISIPSDNQVWVNNQAEASLATAGTGDMLCGLIAGLIAQKVPLRYACLGAVVIQSQLSKKKNCVTVEDFLDNIPQTLKKLKNN